MGGFFKPHDISFLRSWEGTLPLQTDHCKKGIMTFDTNQVICLAPDWSKEVMDFLLLQKYCTCPTEKAQVCCPEGWCNVFVDIRPCTDAECWYASIEVKTVVIAWALDKSDIFIMGCPDIIVVTDRQSLTGLSGDRGLYKIHNLCLFKLKEKLRWYFSLSSTAWASGTGVLMLFPIIQSLQLKPILTYFPYISPPKTSTSQTK